MRYFVSENGLTPITLTDRKLFHVLYEDGYGSTKPTKKDFDRFSNAIDKENILFKHPIYSLDDLCYLCQCNDTGDVALAGLIQDAGECSVDGNIIIVTNISCYFDSFYADVLRVSENNVSVLFRKKYIDDFLTDNP